IIGFGIWILAQRRRPEVAFLWRVSESGDSEQMVPLRQEAKPVIRQGDKITVEASIQNVGDATAERALVNFVVPECFALKGLDSTSSAARTASNKTAGHSPEFR